MAADANAASGKTESFLRMAEPESGGHSNSTGPDGSFMYRIPQTGLDLCPTCKSGTLHPVGQTHDDIHLVCRDNTCGQKVARPKGISMVRYLSGG